MHQLYKLAQDDAGRIRAVSVGIAPRAIQEGERKILVAEEDIDRGENGRTLELGDPSGSEGPSPPWFLRSAVQWLE